MRIFGMPGPIRQTAIANADRRAVAGVEATLRETVGQYRVATLCSANVAIGIVSLLKELEATKSKTELCGTVKNTLMTVHGCQA
jgi:hypothetical protein